METYCLLYKLCMMPYNFPFFHIIESSHNRIKSMYSLDCFIVSTFIFPVYF